MKRKMMGRKVMIEVYEEITSTRNWIAPPGCKSVDAFVVGGGNNGSNGSSMGSGAGGRGGACNTYNNIPVTPGTSVSVVVGGASETSYFISSSYNAIGGGGKIGGAALGQVLSNGRTGSDGNYSFNTALYPRLYGASGGGGAAFAWGTAGERYYGGAGGTHGAGKGGDSYQYAAGPPGGNASFYGAGGGGAGKSDNSSAEGKGGKGYQGIVILHYWKYK